VQSITDDDFMIEDTVSQVAQQEEVQQTIALKTTVKNAFEDLINLESDTCYSVHINAVIEKLESIMTEEEIMFVNFKIVFNVSSNNLMIQTFSIFN
jgi:hypothetical protein